MTRSDTDLIPFGSWLLAQLRARQMSRADLARGAGTRSGVVSSWLYDAPPSPPLCERIARALMLPVDTILTQAGHRPAERQPETELHREALNLIARIPEPYLVLLIPQLRALAEQPAETRAHLIEALTT